MKFFTKTLSALALTLGAAAGFVPAASAQTAPTEKLTLWYTTPADKASSSNKWMDYYLPIGNGQFGAMLSGGVATDEIQFNEKTLWTGKVGQISESSSSNEYGSYQNFGSLKVATGHSSQSNYIRTLDLTTATGTVSYTTDGVEYTRQYIASNPAQVIAVRYAASQGGKLNLTVSLTPGVDGTMTYSNGEGYFSGKLDVVSYNSRFKVVNTGGSLSSKSNGITVSGADEVVIYLAGVTDFDNTKSTYVSGATAEDLANTVSSRLDEAAQKGWASVYSEHVADYQGLFDRMSLNFANAASQSKTTDALIKDHSSESDNLLLQQLYFAYGRYLAIASSRGVALPSNLQGIWNNSSTPAWNSDIHANINVQMNYWPVEVTNLSELHDPFLNWTINMSNSAQWKSYAQHKCSSTDVTSNYGWNLFTENSIFGGTGCWKHQNKVGNAWLCTHLWQHYLYTQDADFLRKAFPTMKSACQYWMDILKESNGEYLCPSEYSPEHGPDNEDGVAYAQQLVAELFANTLDACKVLGVSIDDLQAKYEKLDKGLSTETYTAAGYKKSPSHGYQNWKSGLNGISKNTVLLREWKNSSYYAGEISHRHLSPLMCLYPFDQIKDEKIRTAAQNLLTFRGDDSRGWSMGWKINLWARLKNADKAATIIDNALTHCGTFDASGSTTGGVYYNLLDAHPYFQIDGNFGFTAGIAEMLFQSHAGYLEVLPVLPEAWKSGGQVKGVKGRGNFTVDFNWNSSGKVTEITILNVKGNALNVKCDKGANAKSIANAYVTVAGSKVTPTLVDGTTDVYAIASSAGQEVKIDFVNDGPVVTPDPSFSLTADEKVTAFGEVTTGKTYTRTVKVKGQDLKGNITVASSAEAVLVPAATTITKAQAEAGYDLNVSLKPTAVAENATATLTFATEGAEAQELTFSWTAKAPAVPTLDVSTATTAFGTVTTGETTTATITVKATDLKGDVSVRSDNTVLKPAVSSIAKAAAESATGYLLTVSLLPTKDGTDEATLTFSTDGAETKTLTFSWTAKAPVVVTPSLSVTPADYDWSNVTVGSSATATLSLQGANLNGNVSITSNNPALVPAVTSIAKADVEAGYTLTLTLTPEAAGTGSATVTVKTDGVADQTVTYTWTAQAPVVATPSLSVAQSSYNWSNALVNGTGTTTVTVKGENLQGDVRVASSNSVLTVSATTITQAQAEAGYTLTVTLKPTKKGTDSGTLTFTTAGVDAQTVTYTWTARNMTFWERLFGKKTFSTAVVPSSVDIPTGFRAFKVNGVQNGILTLEEQFTTLEACTPYLLYNYSGNEATVSGYYDNDAMTDNLVTEGFLTGPVYTDQETYAFGNTDYVLQDQGSGSMFYKASGFTLTIPVGKCFLTLPSSSPSSAPAAFRIVIDGEITGLEAVEAESTDDVIYNLKGMRVTRMIPGNVYVVNGKKVVAP